MQSEAMYDIFVNAIKPSIVIGLHEKERSTKQTIQIDLIATPINKLSSQSDDINDTVNYQTLTEFIKEKSLHV